MAKPALDRAHPSGAVAGTTRPVDHTIQDVRMTDGSWGYCEVLATARDHSGRWRIKLLWYDAGPPRAQREDWYLYDAERLRDPPGVDEVPADS